MYLGAITALALVVAIAAGAFRARDLVKMAAAFLLAAVMLAPVAWPYLRMRAHQGVEFTLADVAIYATTLESYAASGTRLYGGLTQRHLDPERVQDALFPGVTLLVLGIAGLARAPRRYRVVALAGLRGRHRVLARARRPPSIDSSTSTWCWCGACAPSRASRWCRCWP